MTASERDRFPTGIAGLDAVLGGGLLRRGVYTVRARPGGGKTVLANQVAFHHARREGRVVYATLLAETHERMLANLEQLAFYDAARVPEQVAYVSGYATLEATGVAGLTEMLRREMRARGATLLVVDALGAVEEAATPAAFKKFVHDLEVHASLLDWTVLLLTAESGVRAGPEATVVDGVIELFDNRHGRRAEREIEVTKFRGSGYVSGGHAFQITREGVVVYPRLEAQLQDPSPDDACKTERVSSGIPTLDRVLHGGLRCASTAVMFGPTGVGKTTIGLHFLDASSEAEPGLHFGFYEPPPRLLVKADALGLDLAAKHKRGIVDMIWYPPTERILDALGQRMLAAVRERGAKRLFVDGIDGFVKAASHPDRISHFFSAITHELRQLGVTAIYTAELFNLFATEVPLPLEGISGLIENAFLLRFVERDAALLRMFSVVKTRDSAYDNTLRELLISARGASLGPALPSGMPGAVGKSSGTMSSRLIGMLKRRRGAP